MMTLYLHVYINSFVCTEEPVDELPKQEVYCVYSVSKYLHIAIDLYCWSKYCVADTAIATIIR